MCWSRGCPTALGETTREQVYAERLQFVDRIPIGGVREGIAAERRCYGIITNPQILMSLSDRGSERVRHGVVKLNMRSGENLF